MTDTNFPLSSAEADDLPRTLRRERERQKAAAAGGTANFAAPASDYASTAAAEDLVPATVKRLDIPFWRLILFFMKAVLAAIPAIILLGAVLWGLGFALKTFFPWLVQAEFIIRLPK